LPAWSFITRGNTENPVISSRRRNKTD